MVGGWRFAAASVIGTSHQKSPEGVCQDSHSAVYLADAGAFVGIVSDGAGSACNGHIGSRLTCDLILQEVEDADPARVFSEAFARDTIEKLRHTIAEEAYCAELTVRDYACTMLVAIVACGTASFWQVGDGAICVREEGSESYGCIYWPEKGDYANVTFFVTDLRAQEETQIICSDKEFVEVALFSDGIERLALDFVAHQAYSAFFGGLFPHMRGLDEGRSPELGKQIEAFLGSERVNKRTDDDKTLILASRTAITS